MKKSTVNKKKKKEVKRKATLTYLNLKVKIHPREKDYYVISGKIRFLIASGKEKSDSTYEIVAKGDMRERLIALKKELLQYIGD